MKFIKKPQEVGYHMIRVDIPPFHCEKCETSVFSQDIRVQGDVTYYYAVCDKCGFEVLNGYYVSTINGCKDGACKL
jgi:hypothetical protein